MTVEKEGSLQGAVFELGEVSLEEQPLYATEIITDPTHHQLIALIFSQASEREDRRTDIYRLAEAAGVKPPAIRKRAKAMLAIGIFEEGSIQLSPGKRPSTLFRLLPLKQVSTKGPKKRLGLTEQQLPLFHGDIEALDDYLIQPPVIDDFFCSILYGAMRVGKRDARTVIDVNLKWGKEPVRVVTTADSEVGAAYVRDLRYVMAILAIATQIIKERKEQGKRARNKFLITTREILDYLGLSNHGGNRTTCYGALLRLEGTKFTFKDPISQALRERFGQDIWGEQGFRFISELGAFGRRNPTEGETPDAFALSLSNLLYERLVDENTFSTFLIWKDLLYEKEDIAIAMMLWCRRVIRLGKKLNLLNYDYFVRAVLPQRPIKKAREEVEDYLRRNIYLPPEDQERDPDYPNEEVGKGKFTARAYGFFITLYSNHVYVRPDPDDPIVGLDSPYYKLNQRGDIGLLSDFD